MQQTVIPLGVMTVIYDIPNIPGTKISIKVFCCAARKGWKSKEKYVMLRTNNDEKIGSIERECPFWMIRDKEQTGEEIK